MGKRKLLNFRIIGNDSEILESFINKHKFYIFKETFNGIRYALNQNKDIAEICSINTDNAIATIEQKHWENALSSSLGYFESQDEYELCNNINRCIKKLQNGNRSLKQLETISGSITTS